MLVYNSPPGGCRGNRNIAPFVLVYKYFTMSLEDIKVLQAENFFPKYTQKELLLLSDKVKYIFHPTITYDPKQKTQLPWIEKWNKHRNIQDTCGFSAVLEPDSDVYKKVSGLVKFHTTKVFNIEIKKILRLMFVILPPNPLYKNDYEMTPHIDINRSTTVPIKNLLYFINDNDAPTVYYSQKVDDMNKVDLSNISIVEKVFPKMGKASIWDGSIVHAASVSKTNLRITLNVLFESTDK